ncbi:MAG TPA: pyridoxamine 5'-phosphate oxidase family protein [Methylomirabilota bacterium]|jgi:PPOX class probable FMN-dependent enzyme|nr:pyridoxamine 5'-phosphate oxidase family protein [Methylomirabilota bacterium]
MFRDVISSEDALRALVGTPSELALKKQLSALEPHSKSFIAHAPFVLVATAGADGRCDVSPKGDAPGFVRVLDDHHLAIPDRPGNKRLDGMRNILANPHVGLIFLIPGRRETLRVNGRACITRDEALLASMEAMGKRPLLAIGVEVEEVYIHCAKAFIRSGLWQPDRWPALEALASTAQMFWDQTTPSCTVDELARHLDESYSKRLY